MSPSLHRIRWRLIWSSLVALILSIGGFYLGQVVYARSDDQCFWRLETRTSVVNGVKRTRQAVVIQEILPNGQAEVATLLEGDELVEINGRKVIPTREGTRLAQQYINQQSERRLLIYTVRREGRLLRIPIMLVKPLDYTVVIALATGLVAWAIGLLVVISAPQRKVARHFYYLGLLTLLIPLGLRNAFGTMPGAMESVATYLNCLVRALGPPLWIHFFLRFPHPFALRTHRRFLQGLYIGFLVLGLACAILIDVRLVEPETMANVGGLAWRVTPGSLLGALVTLSSLVGLGLFWAGALRLPRRRRSGLMPALVISTGVLLGLGAFTFLDYRFGQLSLAFSRERWVFFAPLPLVPLAFGYAIFRHGFFDVRRAILRWITYFLALGLTLVAYLGGLSWLFAQGIQALSPGTAGALLGLAALPVGWILRALLQALRRKFRRDLNTSRDLILGSIRETRKRFSEEALLHGLVESLREAFRPQVLQLLPVEGHTVLLPPVRERDPEDPFHPALSEPCPLVLPSTILRHARDNRELVIGLGSDESDWIREQNPALRAHVDALEAQLLVLVMVGDAPHTAVLLGGKYAELNYGRDDRELLREVAQAASIVLETAVYHRRVLDQNRLEQELQTARRIQENLVTSDPPKVPGFQLALRLDPAFETGGDLLWVRQRGTRWIAAVGDVSGKGMAAALYMAQATALIKYATQHDDFTLETFLPALDRTLRDLMSPRDFITLNLLEWDSSGRYRLARAGHPPALLVKADGEVEELTMPGLGLGLRPRGLHGWTVREGVLAPREWLVMYSDGITEAMDARSEVFGIDRLADRLRRMWGTGSVRAACEAVYRDVIGFESRNRDDRTLFILGRES